MKVIREGKLPEEKVYVGECGNCHCICEAVQRELKANDDGRNGTDYSADCPRCKHKIFFQEK